MAPTNAYTHDYIVIGGGSGGSGAARRAAGWYKAKTLVIENGPSGGCCVNVGYVERDLSTFLHVTIRTILINPHSCVPKKITYNAASVREMLHNGKAYGYDIPSGIPFDFAHFKTLRDASVQRNSKSYETNWAREGIELVKGTATFTGPKELSVALADGSGTKTFTAPHILIATGGYPVMPTNIKGATHGITSDGFFDIEVLPQKIAVVGAGYIAVEMAGILNALGVEVHMFIRGKTFLRKFDPMVQNTITKRYEDVGIAIHKEDEIIKVERLDTPDKEEVGAKHETRGTPPSPSKKLKITAKSGGVFEVDEILWALGRIPETKDLDPASIGVKFTEKGYIAVDEFQNTDVEGIYAIGDVTGQMELTPGMSFFFSFLSFQ
jgi:glutathione reductase (NADPH)